MYSAILRAAFIATLTCAAALAQNSDLGILLGVSVRTSGVVSPGRVEGSVSASVQFNYAIQLHETAAGRLYLELPVLIAANSSDVVAGGPGFGTVSSSHTTTVFFTPGVRWHYTVHPRVAFYAAAGAGIASLEGNYAFIGGGVVSAHHGNTTTGAFGFGGGLDFRVTRLLSLRAEGRDFVTRAGLGGETGHNHPFFTVGIGLHF